MNPNVCLVPFVSFFGGDMTRQSLQQLSLDQDVVAYYGDEESIPSRRTQVEGLGSSDFSRNGLVSDKHM